MKGKKKKQLCPTSHGKQTINCKRILFQHSEQRMRYVVISFVNLFLNWGQLIYYEYLHISLKKRIKIK